MKKTIRPARKDEAPLILTFIQELAAYEKMDDHVETTVASIEEWIFDKAAAHVLVVCIDDVPVGFTLYFFNFSTFKGRSGLYIEDLYVRPEYRGLGLGKLVFKTLAQIATMQRCGRIEWSCLDWNTKSIAFYLSLGAKPMEGWSVFRLEESTFKQME